MKKAFEKVVGFFPKPNQATNIPLELTQTQKLHLSLQELEVMESYIKEAQAEAPTEAFSVKKTISSSSPVIKYSTKKALIDYQREEGIFEFELDDEVVIIDDAKCDVNNSIGTDSTPNTPSIPLTTNHYKGSGHSL